MCIIIDTNTFINVFDRTSAEHNEFSPVLNWICNGEGKVVYGGTKYFKELRKLPYILNIYSELNRRNKGVPVSNDEVDKKTKIASEMIKHRDFDDQHLVGLLLESKCKLICSLDKRAHPYFIHKSFFPSKPPKIYSGKAHKKLLNRKNIAAICKPCTIMTTKQKVTFVKLLK